MGEDAAPPLGRITEEGIALLVERFYARVRRDPELGPIFEQAVGADWDAHLATLRAFWSSVMLTTGRYRGNPMRVHHQLGLIRPEHFERWLALFGETCDELFAAEAAAAFRDKAERIAKSLRAGSLRAGLFRQSGLAVRAAAP